MVNNSPNLSDPDERLRIKSMVHAFANSKHGIGDASVQFWMNEFELYYSGDDSFVNISQIADERSFYGLLMHFFSAKTTDIWPEDVAWANRHSNDSFSKIKSFR